MTTTCRWEAAESSTVDTPPPPAPERGTGATERSRRRRGWALLITAAIVVSAVAAGIGRGAVFKPEGAGSLLDFFAAAVSPRLDASFLALTGTAMLTTLAYAVLGTALSLAIGLIGGVLSSQTWWSSGVRARRGRRLVGWVFARSVLVVPRGIHEVVWGLFFLVVFGIDPIVAVLAIGIPFGAVTAKVFSELLDETGRKPYTALLAAGATKRSAVLYGLLPPALPDLLSYGFYRFECAIRSAAILGLVGAGGLGFQLALSFQTLRYQEIWTLLFALILLSVAADYWSSLVRSARARGRRRSRDGGGVRRDPLLTGSLVFAAVLIGLSSWWVGLDVAVLWSGKAWEFGLQLLSDAWPPSIGDSGVGGLLTLAGVTLAMSIVAITIAFGLGALFAVPASTPAHGRDRVERGRVSTAARMLAMLASRFVLVVLRAIPPPVWALLLLFVMYPGILPGALALAVYTTGVLGRLMAESVDNLEVRPLRALRAHGASEAKVFCYGVIPAAAPRFVAYGLYRWEVTIRETVVVGVVGAGGLGLLLDHQIGAFDYAGALTTLALLIGLTLAVDITSAAIRRSVR
ncbi:MAG: ABC transporter permease subunit [Actinophytocola sp.]|nr:ABC transporter permease subunit [Actinophytocola sp.]